ncbi:MAG TPA: hypothetical protein VKY92_13040 [Verrucomicrobiae bacterium]|jgi:hypothetical protein|nr:hypothetical protein [Verrucomicrobiae bacterium]
MHNFRFLPIVAVLLTALRLNAADDYKLGPDSQFKPDVPHGRVERFQITNSTVFPGQFVTAGFTFRRSTIPPRRPHSWFFTMVSAI